MNRLVSMTPRGALRPAALLSLAVLAVACADPGTRSTAEGAMNNTNMTAQPSAVTATAATGAGNPLAAMRMDHTALRVPNFEETVRWYKEKLGFRELVRWKAPPYVDPDLQFAYLELNGAVIEIAGGGNASRSLPELRDIKDTFRTQGYIHVCLRVDDIEAATAELRRRGVEVFAGPNTNSSLNRKFIHFKDNNGFDVEIVQYL